MRIYRCAADEGDYAGFAVTESAIFLTVSQAGQDDGQPDVAELSFTAAQARALGDKLHQLLSEHGKAAEVHGVYLGRTTDQPGILVSAGIDGGTCRSVVLARKDAADLADRLTVAGTTQAGPGTEQAGQALSVAELFRRATALRITATVFEVDEVDLFDAAEWVVTDTEERAA
ncbi:hypothetical protein ATK36_3167 [Amycolatopsis sulphurea]|uniref:Uncharacterized protein n=1 Tax=Amycolatopsis sulphurea TaxID=76022 RepID=A0A2A9FAW7_9PSEU|nr:hypothetical protein [Amycolatopsis sulphurea]PFG48093.1 hypothetical protein ATK36_3167 [Amycolatopsis sulphurea]